MQSIERLGERERRRVVEAAFAEVARLDEPGNPRGEALTAEEKHRLGEFWAEIINAMGGTVVVMEGKSDHD